jgi:transketolase C-terminal domain/subunit
MLLVLVEDLGFQKKSNEVQTEFGKHFLDMGQREAMLLNVE